jgi:hypothetical protein
MAAADPGCFDVEAQQVFEQWLTLGSMPLAVAQRMLVAKMVEVPLRTVLTATLFP